MAHSRASYALQWSIEDLLARATRSCGFYLITSAERLTWKEFSSRHARMLHLMRKAASRRAIPRFGGVRVFEEGETTFRPHAHWVMTPRLSQAVVQHYADVAQLGHVWLDWRIAGGPLAKYLCKYLNKSQLSLHGLRRWSCFGDYDGVKVADVELDSEAIRLFRAHRLECLRHGMSKTQAYVEARRRCSLSKFGMFVDTQQGIAPSLPSQSPATDKTLVINKLDNSGEVCIVRHDGTREHIYGR